jgi:hypothetical protein
MTDTATTEKPIASAEFFGGAEISSAIKALSTEDRLKLYLIAQRRSNGTGMTAQSLLNETFCRAMLGKRRCPRDVPFVAFLVETIRSISSHARDKHKAQRGRVNTEDGIDPVLLAE